MSRTEPHVVTPLRTIVRGALAGAAGTAMMTLHQHIRQRLASQGEERPESDEPAAGDDPWETAPAPAQVGRRLIEGVLQRRVSPASIPRLAQAMHWSYGTAFGGVYAIIRESVLIPGRRLGPLFGIGVWAGSYAQLVPLGIYEPPWRYPPGELANELGFHLTYGIGVAAGYEMVTRLDRA